MPVPLAFHKIDNRFEWGLTRNTIGGFSRIVEYLNKSSFQCPSEPFEISFDDGYESVYQNALPLLGKSSLRAIAFVIAGYIGKHSGLDVYPGAGRFTHLNAKQIRILCQRGIAIGSHTMTHNNLTKMTADQLEYEFSESKRILENICEQEISAISYPYGKYDEKVIEVALKCGYRYGYTFFRDQTGKNDGLYQDMARERLPIYLFDTPLSMMIKFKGLGQFENIKGRIIKSYNRFSDMLAKRTNKL